MKKRYKHNLSNKFSGTCKLGELVPVNLTEVLPGDSFLGESTSLLRLMPMLAPQLTKINAHIVHYYIPMRLLFDDWEDFITGGEDGDQTPTLPTINLGTVTKGSLADYFGIPLGVANTTVNAMPFRAYALIWQHHFRDKDINTDLVISTAAGTDTTTSIVLKRVNWARDHFTSAKPWEQRGTAVSFPLGTSAAIYGDGMDFGGTDVITNQAQILDAPGGNLRQLDTSLAMLHGHTSGSGTTSMRVDLTNATSSTVTDVREAYAIQRFMERQAMYGGTYAEYLNQLGVGSLDARLNKPEYLAGGRSPIQVSEVMQTGVNSIDEGVGTMFGHGIGGIKSNQFKRSIPEHGYIMSLMYVRPEAHYMDGLNKMWSRSERADFYDHDLASIGMQEVTNKEVYLGHTTPDGVHGYNWRYFDYMAKSNIIAGDFRDTTMNHWHLARDFAADTALNESFIECNPSARIFAEQSEDHIVLLVNNKLVARRMVAPPSTFVR